MKHASGWLVDEVPVFVRHPVVATSPRYRTEVSTDLIRGPWTVVYANEPFDTRPAEHFVRCRLL